MPSRPSSDARRSAIALGRARRLRRRVAVAQPGDQRLGRAHRLRPAAQHGREDALDGLVECLVVGVHLVREADRAARARLSMSSPVRNSARACERPMRASAKGAIVAGNQPEPHLGEAEARVLAREHDVAAAREAGAAAERGAVDPRDHRHGAGVDGREHRGEALGVGDVLLVRELARGPHPLEVGTGAERGAAAGEHDRAQRRVGGQQPRTSRAARRSCRASNALRRSGRSSQTRATPPSRSTSDAAHMRNTPKRGSGIGARAAAARPSASTRRVSRGSIMPSSHSRARRVARVALLLVALEDRLRERRARLLVHVLAARPQCIQAHGQERLGGLARAHHRDPRVRPHEAAGAARRRARTCRSCRRRRSRRSTTVNFGTCAHATAITSLAPSLAMPPCS